MLIARRINGIKRFVAKNDSERNWVLQTCDEKSLMMFANLFANSLTLVIGMSIRLQLSIDRIHTEKGNRTRSKNETGF